MHCTIRRSMRRMCITFVIILHGLAAAVASAQTTTPTADSLILFASPEGMELLERAEQKVDFFNLAPQFESQINRAYCGPTTVAIVLNALRVSQLRDGSLPLPH